LSIAANSATGDNSPTENQEAEKTAAAAEKWEGSGIRPRKGVFLLIAVKSRRSHGGCRDWIPSTDVPARERAWRLAQKREVAVHRCCLRQSLPSTANISLRVGTLKNFSNQHYAPRHEHKTNGSIINSRSDTYSEDGKLGNVSLHGLVAQIIRFAKIQENLFFHLEMFSWTVLTHRANQLLFQFPIP
jgi:hypothetical protein